MLIQFLVPKPRTNFPAPFSTYLNVGAVISTARVYGKNAAMTSSNSLQKRDSLKQEFGAASYLCGSGSGVQKL
jgi:hypothetical protein